MRIHLPLRFLSSGDDWTLEFEHAFRAFYSQVFEPAFPDPDIRESAANLKRLCDPRLFGSREPRGFVDLAMALRGNREIPVGGIVCELFRSVDAALVAYVVAAQGWRGKGIAAALLNYAREGLEARRLGSGRPLLIFAEAEKETASEDDRVRLLALDRLGFSVLDCDYVQPPLGAGKHHVPLRLLVHEPYGDAVPAARVWQFLHAFYRSILGEALDQDEVLQDVLARIALCDAIGVEPLLAD